MQVPDGIGIFSAQFAREGDDLVIAAKGAAPLTVLDYFTADTPPALVMPNGAMLTGGVVELLAGPRAPAQYAQADAPEGAPAIGQVEALTGSSTATRVTGETVELGRGDPVFQGDVVQTGAESTLGLRLEDGTLASMSANSRLVLNEFVFETGGSDNWMLVDLVEGAFAFLTGAIAPSGGMEITTPVAVMAIRGTMPVAFVAGEDGASQFFAASDQDYELLHLITRELLTVITSAAGVSLSSPDAPLQPIELDPETLDAIDGLLDVLNEAAASLGLLGIQDGSSFHPFSPFGSIDGNVASLIEFLLLLEGALTEEAVFEVEDPSQFLLAQALAQAEIELIAVPDEATTQQTGPVPIDVLANDIHPEGSDLSIIFASLPSGHGTVEIVEGEDGQFLHYDPGTAFDYLAKDETFDVVITYTITNGSGAVASTTATVTITGLNDAPVITGVTNPTALLFELPDQIGSDELLETQGSIDFVDVDTSDNAHVESVEVIADGVTTGLGLDEAALLELFTTTMTAPSATTTAGSVAWTFAIADLEVDYLAEGEDLVLTYTVTITDDHGASDKQDVTVTITGRNDKPVVTAVTNPTPQLFELPDQIGSDEVLETQGSIDFVDVDIADNAHVESVSVAADGVTTGLGLDETALLELFTTTLTAPSATTTTGSVAWTFAIADMEVDYLAEGEDLVLTYTVTITDDHGASASQDVTVTITGRNDKPTIVAHATNASETVYELEDETGSTHVHQVDGIIAFADVDVSDTHDATFAADGSGYVGSFGLGDVDQDGKTVGWTFTVVDADIDHLPEGEKLIQTYTVTISDGQGGTAEQVVTITLIGANDAPIIEVGDGDSDAAKLLETDEPLTAEGSLTVIDVSVSDVVTATVTKVVASGDNHTLIANETLLGFLTVDSPVLGATESEGTLTWTFDSIDEAFDFMADSEKLVLTYTVSVDDGIDTTSHEVTITIIGTNDAPVITGVTNPTSQLFEIADQIGSDELLETQGSIDFVDVDISDNAHVESVSVAADGVTTGLELDEAALLELFTTTMTAPSATTTAGSVAWTFAIADLEVDYLAEGEDLVLTYTVTITDDHGASDKQDVTVTITGTNDAPVITVGTGDSIAGEVTEDAVDDLEEGSLVAAGTLGFEDVDLSDAHTAGASQTSANWYDAEGGTVGTPLPSGLAAALDAALTAAIADPATSDGTGSISWSFALDNDLVQFLAAGETLVLTYAVTLSDGIATTSQDVTVTITGTNDAPVITVKDDDEDAVVLSAVVATATIVLISMENGSPLYPHPGPDNGTLTFNLSMDGGETFETVTIEFEMGPSHVATVTNLVAAINSSEYDFLEAVNDGAPYEFTLTVNSDEVFAPVFDEDGVVFTNHELRSVAVDAEVVQQGSDAEPLTASGTLTVTDVDVSDKVDVSVKSVSVTGDTKIPEETLLAMMSVDDAAVIASGETVGTINWEFDAGSEAFSFLEPGETLVLTYTIHVTDTHGVSAEHQVTVTIKGYSATDPIILDLGEPGFDLSGTAAFDLNNDGQLQTLAWTGGEDGILVMDLDGSGAIESGNEVFSPYFNGGGFADALDALASLDTNGDGIIDENDEAFADLLVWIDANSDGISQPGELVSLADLGIVSIDLGAEAVDYTIDGQKIMAEGQFTYNDGTMGDYVAVELNEMSSSSDALVSDVEDGGIEGQGQLFTLTDLSIHEVIVDYREGDVIDLTQLGFAVANGQAVEEYVRYDSDTGELFVDVDGLDGPAQFELVAELTTPPPSALVRLVDGDTFTNVEIA